MFPPQSYGSGKTCFSMGFIFKEVNLIIIIISWVSLPRMSAIEVLPGTFTYFVFLGEIFPNRYHMLNGSRAI